MCHIYGHHVSGRNHKRLQCGYWRGALQQRIGPAERSPRRQYVRILLCRGQRCVAGDHDLHQRQLIGSGDKRATVRPPYYRHHRCILSAVQSGIYSSNEQERRMSSARSLRLSRNIRVNIEIFGPVYSTRKHSSTPAFAKAARSYSARPPDALT